MDVFVREACATNPSPPPPRLRVECHRNWITPPARNIKSQPRSEEQNFKNMQITSSFTVLAPVEIGRLSYVSHNIRGVREDCGKGVSMLHCSAPRETATGVDSFIPSFSSLSACLCFLFVFIPQSLRHSNPHYITNAPQHSNCLRVNLLFEQIFLLISKYKSNQYTSMSF